MLYGRDAERSAVTTLLDAARDSRSGVLVLRGQPGAGKSALLQDAVEQASDLQVLEARGIESEAELAFAGLHQLLRPILGQVDGLPGPQATALRAAFGLEQGRVEDRFLVSVAVLSLLAEAAERRPVLCIVDDAHWLDEASANALVFVARRLEAEGVVVLFAARDGDPRRFGAVGLPELEIGGLDEVAVAALLADREGDADRRAWHLAAAAVEPDQRVVRELDAAAERALGRGGFEAASSALERAATLTADPGVRGRRLVAAAEHAWAAGQLGRTAGLLEAVRPLATEPLLRADVGRLRGWFELSVGSVATAQPILVQAALDAAPVDPGRARRILAGAAEAAWLEADRNAGADLSRAAARLGSADSAHDRYFTDLTAGFLAYLEDDTAVAVRRLTDAIGLAGRLD